MSSNDLLNIFTSLGLQMRTKTEPLSQQLLRLEAQRWRPIRPKITPIFTAGKLREMFTLIVECSKNLEGYLNNVVGKGEPVKVSELSAQFTTDVIGTCAFGINMNAMGEKESEFRRRGRSVFEPTVENILRLKTSLEYPKLYDFLGFVVPEKRQTRFFTKIVKDAIKSRREHGIYRPDFINILMELQNHPEQVEGVDGKDNVDGNLFVVSTFKAYLVPKLLQMFCIRDVSIRLVLLSHFNSFVHTFQADELKSQVLPELLVGIKDTNDHLVSSTLKALADVVPILGAATVVGGNRGKLFTDGRPNKVKDNGQDNKAVSSFVNIVDFAATTSQNIINLPERPSPDGGEDKKENISSITEEEYTWSDWETQESSTRDAHPQISQSCDQTSESIANDVSTVDLVPIIDTNPVFDLNKAKAIESKFPKKSIVLCDISELDIKNSKLTNSIKEEYDFFTDMEPVIKKTQVLHVQQPQLTSKSVFDIKALNELDVSEENDGWDEDLSDWGMNDAQELKI